MPRSRKRCRTCNELRSLEEFPQTKAGRLKGTCDLCYKLRAEEKRNRQYSLESGELQELKQSQQSKCAICFREVPLCVDHNHDTGAIRGLLCQSCNTGLGFFKDSITLLKNAQMYLTKANYSQSTLDQKLRKLYPPGKATAANFKNFSRRDVT